MMMMSDDAGRILYSEPMAKSVSAIASNFCRVTAA